MNANYGQRRWNLRRVLKWTGIGLGCLLVLLVGALGVATWLLTPDRLTRIVNEKASEMLNADVRASNIQFTVWSTFPHLDIEMDSLYVRSRNFDSIPDSLRRCLPKDADFLLSTSRVHGGINLLKLLGGRIWLRNLQADSLHVNLVDATESLNNYDITQTSGATKVPYFNIDKLRITEGGCVRYTSLPSGSKAEVDLSGMSLMPAGKENAYRLALAGTVSASSDRLVILDKFPFGLDGDVNVRFKPFGIEASNYKVALGKIDGRMSMDMDIGGQAKINTFNYRLKNFTLADLDELLPAGSYPVLRRLSADLALDCSARLTTPYNFSSAFLPSVNVDFSVPEGEIDYTMSDGKQYAIKKLSLRGRLVFDGEHPDQSYVEVPEFMLEGGGTRLRAEGRVEHLTTNPEVHALLLGSVDLDEARRVVDELRPFSPTGKLGFRADMGFRMEDNALYGSLLDIEVTGPRAGVTVKGNRVELHNLHARTGEKYAYGLNRNALMHDIPADLQLTADRLMLTLPDGGGKLVVDNARASGFLSREKRGAVLRNLDVSVSGKRMQYSHDGSKVDLNGASLRLQAERLATPKTVAPFATPAAWSADARSLGFAPHTPELLRVDLNDDVRSLMQNWLAHLDLTIHGATMQTPGYAATTTMQNLDLTATFDSVTLHRVRIDSGRSGGDISACISNLRQFLLSPTPAPLLVDIDMRLDTIQMNQLARAYASTHPEIKGKGKVETAPDSVAGNNAYKKAYIVPRNLRANIHTTAAQARYINLHLYDLVTDISVADGNASVDSLHIAADFGNADMKMRYNTADLQNMSVDATAAINDVNVVKFFQNFHSLLEMMPQMKNLSGMLSADMTGRVRIYPNMDLMVPSLWADANLDAWNLVIHQNKFIRHLTTMLLIPSNEDLNIADMKIHAGIHSNLLEVFPFIFEVEKYKLCLGGLNNFNGDLYYHVGVEDWPLKFPFGVNVKGTYSNPVLRFGGKEWHDSNGAMITRGVQDHDHLNLVDEATKYTSEFVRTAANYVEK